MTVLINLRYCSFFVHFSVRGCSEIERSLAGDGAQPCLLHTNSRPPPSRSVSSTEVKEFQFSANQLISGHLSSTRDYRSSVSSPPSKRKQDYARQLAGSSRRNDFQNRKKSWIRCNAESDLLQEPHRNAPRAKQVGVLREMITASRNN